MQGGSRWLASLRADAQANHDRLLEVAPRAFARDGADTSLKAIAAEAGVGIGTLYRRFPTREDLDRGHLPQRDRPPRGVGRRPASGRARVDALRAWMERFVDYMLTKQGMAEALPGDPCLPRRAARPQPRGAAARRSERCWRRDRAGRGALGHRSGGRAHGARRDHPHQRARRPTPAGNSADRTS